MTLRFWEPLFPETLRRLPIPEKQQKPIGISPVKEFWTWLGRSATGGVFSARCTWELIINNSGRTLQLPSE